MDTRPTNSRPSLDGTSTRTSRRHRRMSFVLCFVRHSPRSKSTRSDHKRMTSRGGGGSRFSIATSTGTKDDTRHTTHPPSANNISISSISIITHRSRTRRAPHPGDRVCIPVLPRIHPIDPFGAERTLSKQRNRRMKPSEDEWKTVTKSDKKRIFRQGKKKKGATKAQSWQMDHASDSASTGTILQGSAMLGDELEKVSSKCQRDLLPTKLFSQLQEVLSRTPPPTSIVCYGLGNFALKQSEPSASMWQLACVLQLRDSWKKEGKDIPMYYFEPFILAEEATFLRTLSVDVISENEKGRRLAKEPTFFFMPHCPLGLYSNLLFTNVACLGHVSIFGNSLAAYASRLEQNCNTKLLRTLQPFWDESLIGMSNDEILSMPGQFEQGFNDSAVICFTGAEDLALPSALSEELLRIQDDSDEVL